ncbi:MAG: PDZ domain-containing protein [Pseudomonadota bacterium]
MTGKNRYLLTTALALCLAGPLLAQQAPEPPEAPEAPLAEREARLKEAERRLQAAAQEVARLSRDMSPESVIITERLVSAQSGPKLGLSLATEESTDSSGKRETSGVKIVGVAPGSAAAEAGIKSGDVLIGFAGDDLSDRSAVEAVELIGERLRDAEEGDSFPLRFTRDGKAQGADVTLTDAAFAPNVFAFSTGQQDFDFRVIERANAENMRALEMVERARVIGERNLGDAQRFLFLASDSPWSSMELVELTPRLGKYFKADDGLLVVRAPESEDLGFEDGDVIREIGGRKPADVSHAMRILRSYDEGEALEVEIVRDGRRRTIEIEVPERVGDNNRLFWDLKDNDQVHVAPRSAN